MLGTPRGRECDRSNGERRHRRDGASNNHPRLGWVSFQTLGWVNFQALPTIDPSNRLVAYPFTRITRLQQNSGPLRHPTRPDLTLTGFQLKFTPLIEGASRLPISFRLHAC